MRHNSLSFATALMVGGALLLSGCSAPSPTVTPDASESAPAKPQEAPASDGTPRGTDLATATFAMSWTDAIKAATDRFSGEPVALSLEWKRDAYAYEVELVGETETYEAKFNADTGELIAEKKEQRSAEKIADKRRDIFAPADLIDPNAAMEAALGAVKGTVDEWEIEEEDGAIIYQVQVLDGSQDVDVDVDAASGAVIEVDR